MPPEPPAWREGEFRVDVSTLVGQFWLLPSLWLSSCSADQLWRLLVASAHDPELGAEERTDRTELVNDDARQLDGIS